MRWAISYFKDNMRFNVVGNLFSVGQNERGFK